MPFSTARIFIVGCKRRAILQNWSLRSGNRCKLVSSPIFCPKEKAGKADAAPTVISCFTAIITVRMCHLTGKHQIFGQGKPVIFSIIFHDVGFSKEEHLSSHVPLPLRSQTGLYANPAKRDSNSTPLRGLRTFSLGIPRFCSL